jgi:hypothetical protein
MDVKSTWVLTWHRMDHVFMVTWTIFKYHLLEVGLTQNHTLESHPKAISMGVGKSILCSHRPSSIVWSENGPCCGTIAYFVGGKKGMIWFNIICLKLYQFRRITRWCLYVLESVVESTLQSVLKFVILEKNIIKNYGLLEFLSGPPPRGGLDTNSKRPWNLIHGPSCKTPCRLFIHEVFLWAFRPSPSCVKWTWTVSTLSTNESS